MRRILVIDDDPDMLYFCRSVIAKMGYEAVLAVSPREAEDLLHNHTVSLILLDIGLQDMSGIDAIQLLSGLQGPGTPIVMLTASAARGDVTRSVTEGAAGYILKPILPDDLIQRLTGFLSKVPREPVFAIPPKSALAPAEIECASAPGDAPYDLRLPGRLESVSPLGVSVLVSEPIPEDRPIKVRSHAFKAMGFDSPFLVLKAYSCEADAASGGHRILASTISLVSKPQVQRIRTAVERWCRTGVAA